MSRPNRLSMWQAALLFAPMSASLSLLCLTQVVDAATVTWRGTVDGAWNTTTANWAGGSTVYTAGDTVTFDDTATGTTGITIANAVTPSGTVTINNTTKDYSLSGASGLVGNVSLLKLGAGSLTITGSNTYTGANATVLRGGTTTISGNAVVTSTNSTVNTFNMATTAGDNATLVIRDNASVTSNALLMATNATATATTLMQGGTLTILMGNGAANNFTRIGSSGTGVFTQTGGLVTIDGGGSGLPTLGRILGSRGDLSVSSGTFRLTGNGVLQVGYDGVGAMTVSGNGVIDTGTGTGRLLVVSTGSGAGTVNLDGGTLRSRQVATSGVAASTSTFNFNSGTLAALQSTTSYLQGLTAAYVKSGGAVIDTNTYDITIAQSLLTDGTSLGGGLTKTGVGSLTLSGTNTYTGVTTINAGRLVAATLANGGIASSIGVSSKANSNLVLAGGTFAYSGTSVAIDRGLLFSGSTTTAAIEVTQAGTNLSISGTADLTSTSGTAYQVLNKTGAGTLTIQGGKPAGSASYVGANPGTGNYDVGINVQQGSLVLSGSGNDNWFVNAGRFSILAGGTMQVSNGAFSTRIATDPSINGSAFVWVGGTNVNGNTAGSSAPTTLTFTSVSGTVGSFIVGVNSTGTSSVVLNDSVLTGMGPNVRLGRLAGANAAMSLAGSSQLILSGTPGATSRPSFTMGYSGLTTNALTLADSSQLTTGVFYMAENGTSSTNTISLTGTSRLTVDNASLYMGSNGSIVGGSNSINRLTVADSSTVAFSGTAASRSFIIGSGTGSLATVLVKDSAVLTTGTSDLTVGRSSLATGSLTVQNNAAVTSGLVRIGQDAGSAGVVSLNGGMLSTTGIVPGAGSSTLNFDGGRLVTLAGGTLSGLTALNVLAGGATINTNGAAYQISQSLLDGSGGGGLTKTGLGTLTLAGANTYTGATTINQGILAITSTSALPGYATPGKVSVASGAGLAVPNAFDAAAVAQLLTTASFAAGSQIGFDTSAGDRTYGTAIGGSLGVAKTGGNMLTLSASNAYTGPTTIAGGVLQAANSNALGGGGNIAFTGGAVQFTSDSAGQDWASRIKNSTSAVSLDTNGQNVTFTVGIDSSNTGGFTKNGLGTLTFTGNNTYTGTTFVNSGTFVLSGNGSVTSNIQVADAAGSAATVTMTGGVISATSGFFRIGGTGTGTWNQSGGLVTVANMLPTVGRFAGSFSQMNLSSGTFQLTGTTGDMQVGAAGQGTLTMSGNGVLETGTAAGRLLLVSQNSTGTGVVNLDGGTIRTRQVATTGTVGSSSTFNFNGGKLVALASSTTFMQGLTAANVNAGGADVDTNGNDVTIAQALLAGGGGLTKRGAGSLTLAGVNTYTGPTAVNGGALVVNGSLVGSVAISAGASLGGSGSVGAISGAGLVGPGNSPGILTASSIDPFGGLSFAFEFTQAAPNYSSPTGSANDVLWLTGGTPFVSSLSSANAVSIYLTPSLVASGTVTGGFFTSSTSDFLANMSGGSFQYFVQDASGTYSYNGQTYMTLSQYDSSKSVTLSTVAQNGGQVMQMVVVPEPTGIVIAGVGAALAGLAAARRSRRGR